MLERLGRFLYRRRTWVLWGTLAFVLLSGALGGKVSDVLKPGGFDSDDEESYRAADVLQEKFRQAPPNFLLLVTTKQGGVNDAPVKTEGSRIVADLTKEDGIGQVISHWQIGAVSPLMSKDGKQAIVLAEI